jgi:hypothetical protein
MTIVLLWLYIRAFRRQCFPRLPGKTGRAKEFPNIALECSLEINISILGYIIICNIIVDVIQVYNIHSFS